jgi:hypothetical protein
MTFYSELCQDHQGIYALVEEGVPFVWDDFTQSSFDALKKELMSSPLLSPLDYSKYFLLYLAASESLLAWF